MTNGKADGERLTIAAASEAVRKGELTPVDLVRRCLERIDRHEKQVRAWVSVDRDGALAEAEKLTVELKKGAWRGPLHGIPIGVKDIFDVFDWPTAAGSKLWANSIARKDAVVVKKLRQAGAILLGKTVTTAYASFDPPVTRNPWNLSKTPGGSSSGSAAAVACGMCLGALASQTGGSITRPASFCGVCSIKPTYGRASVDGVVPLAPSMDHVGVMANCVRDLAILFEAISGPSTSEAWQIPEAIPAAVYTVEQRLDPNCKERPPAFAHLRGMFDEMATPEMRSVMDRLDFDLRSLASTQASVTSAVPPTGFAEVLRRHRTIMAVEAAQFHAERMKRHPDDYPPRVTELVEEGMRTTAVDYRNARLERDYLQIEMGNTFVTDYMMTPATLGAAPDADTTGDPAFNSPWSFTGHPTVSLPVGRSADGMPLCIQLVGQNQSENYLLAAAAWLERVVEQEKMYVRHFPEPC